MKEVKEQKKCKYKELIFELEKDIPKERLELILIIFGDEIECSNPADPKSKHGLCIFHDLELWKTKGEEIRREFYERLRKKI